MTQARRAVHFVCLLLLVAGLSGCGGAGDVPSAGALGNAPGSNAGGSPEPINQALVFNGPVRQVLGVPNGSGDVYVRGDFSAYRDQSVAPVVRLRADGSLNGSFRLPASIDHQISGLALADDGSGDLYIADYVIERGVASSIGTGRIWRIHSDGTIDSTFAMGTFSIESDAFPPDPEFRPVVRSIAAMGDGSGRVYVAAGGRYNGTAVGQVVRLNRNGSLDAGFTDQAPYPVFRVVPANDGTGDLYIGTYDRDSPSGWVSHYLLRLNADGTLDAGFNTAAFVWVEARIAFMIPVGDGSGDLFAVGTFLNLAESNPGGPNAFRGLVRVNPNGAIDRLSPKPQVDPLATVNVMVKATDQSGDWFVGQRTALDQFKVVRYKADGTVNPRFTTVQLVGNNLNTLMPSPDTTGDLYIGGDFWSYNGAAVNHLIRVNSDGTLDSGA